MTSKRQPFWCGAWLALLLAGLSACDASGPETEEKSSLSTIEGSVYYRERMALPPGAELTVELQDISRPDAPATTLASVVTPASAGPPYAFSIEYRPGQIDSRHRYGLRAAITFEGRLLFTNTDYINPFAEGAQGPEGSLEVLVRRAPEAAGGSSAATEAPPLERTRWVLESLAGHTVSPGAGGRALDLTLDPEQRQAGGFSGCNRFGGPYQLGDDAAGPERSLELGPLAGTLMACPGGGDLEQPYLDALVRVDSLRQSGNTLSLLAGSQVVATFTPAEG